ncbi:MAG: single-stranded-DNA-specific exonuclease RecJ [Pseudomonadota bacterium]
MTLLRSSLRNICAGRAGEGATTDDHVLGVAHSVSGRAWRHRIGPEGERIATALAQRTGVSEVVARVLVGRGVDLDGAQTALSPTLRALLPDPSRLTDCDRLVARLADAVEAGERIVLFGDYDVDGATSCALVARVLSHFGPPPKIVIPDRITDGYGPSVPVMTALAAEADIVLTLDCGAAATEPVAAGVAAGLTILVIDHHPVDEVAPAHAVVNPNRPDDLSGLGALAAVGVAFVVMVGLLRELRARGHACPDIRALTDLVALGTIADVVPLTDLNRAFVRVGLKAMARRANLGLAALADASRIGGPVAAHHLGYVLGPRINAGGRIGDAALGARLLTTDDALEAGTIAADLSRLNDERRAIERGALTEAAAMVREDAPVIVVSGPWHPGVVGLVASRLKERFRRPALAIGRNGAMGTGSGRSIPGVDLGAAVRAAAADGIIEKGGGHAMAAGLTVQPDAIAALTAFLTARLSADVAAARAAEAIEIDTVVSLGAVGFELAEALSGVGPFGAGRPRPVLGFSAVLTRVLAVGQGDTLRLTARGIDGATRTVMVFRADADFVATLKRLEGESVQMAVHVETGVFRGETRLELTLVDISPAAEAAARAA